MSAIIAITKLQNYLLQYLIPTVPHMFRFSATCLPAGSVPMLFARWDGYYFYLLLLVGCSAQLSPVLVGIVISRMGQLSTTIFPYHYQLTQLHAS